MSNTDMSEWMVTRIADVVLVKNDTGFVDIGGRKIKYFNERRWHGLVLKLSGRSVYSVDGQPSVELGPGQLTYLPKGRPYNTETIESGPCYCVNFLIEGDTDAEVFTVTPRNFEKMQTDFIEMLHCWTYRHPGYRARLRARLYDLLASIEEDKNARYLPERQAAILRDRMSEFEQNLKTPLSVPDLAAECGMCETYFRRIFRELYGQSPKKYILEARFRQAKAQLRNTDAGIAYIADECGFENIYHFSRAFRIHEGVSPTEYRRLHTTLKSDT